MIEGKFGYDLYKQRSIDFKSICIFKESRKWISYHIWVPSFAILCPHFTCECKCTRNWLEHMRITHLFLCAHLVLVMYNIQCRNKDKCARFSKTLCARKKTSLSQPSGMKNRKDGSLNRFLNAAQPIVSTLK